MSAIIYETINLYNKENNIFPYRYIGSDHHNKPKYFGSNKNLVKDIKKLGPQYFEKKILIEFKYNISNILLRKIESEIQKFLDVANNIEYYNKTNSSHIGYIETPEEKKERMNKLHTAQKLWWQSISQEEKNKIYKNLPHEYAKSIKNKTYEERYGVEKAKIIKQKHSGKNNGMAKQVLDIKTGKIFDTIKEALEYYGIKKYETLRKKCLMEIDMKFIK